MYLVRYISSVIKDDIPKLSKAEKQKIKLAIEGRLVIKPINFSQPLQYSLQGCRRMRVGNYRIIFKIKNKEILIVKIGHRKEVYKSKN